MSDEQKPQEDAVPESAQEFNLEAGPLKTSVEALMARLGLATSPSGEPGASGDEDHTEGEPDVPAGVKKEEEAFDPAKEDWSKFDLDPDLAHLYPRSEIVDTGEGMVFVVRQPQFHISSQNVNKNIAGTFITSMVNGPEQWQLSALVPNGSGLLTVVLMRHVRAKLPHPVLLETETVVEAPTDEELAATEDAGLAWAGQPVTPEKQVVLDQIAQEAEAQAVTLDGAVEGADVQVDG